MIAGVLTFFTGGIGRWIALAALVTFAVFMLRLHWMQEGREELTLENVAAAVKIVKIQGAVTERIVTQYVKVAGATKVVTETVEKKVVEYAQANPGLCLDPAWRGLHDSAAANTLPAGAQRSHGGLRASTGSASGFRLTDSGASLADGYIELWPPSSVR